MKVAILQTVPDAYIRNENNAGGRYKPELHGVDVLPWDDIKRTDCILIDHRSTRDTSRWVSVDRKRPYMIYRLSKRTHAWHALGSSATLERAVAIANKLAKEIT